MLLGKTKITGAKELDRVLSELPKRLQRKVVTQALRAGAKPMLEEARNSIPVKSGLTKKDIKIRAIPAKESRAPAIAIAGSLAKAGRAYIMRFLELGTSKMPAKPFLRPAFDNNSARSLEIVGKELGHRIAAEAAKLRRK
jgi:HK97 gp10 family phage protein